MVAFLGKMVQYLPRARAQSPVLGAVASRGALLCLLALGVVPLSWAQQVPAWPRQATTGRIEFTGVLPWPTSSLALTQQRALARRWYRAKLTQATPAQQAEWATQQATFAGLPTLAYVDSVVYSPDATGVVDSVADRVIWRLLYHVRLAATPGGLSYHLSQFTCIELLSDTSTSGALETVLTQYAAEQAVFYRRLHKALASW